MRDNLTNPNPPHAKAVVNDALKLLETVRNLADGKGSKAVAVVSLLAAAGAGWIAYEKTGDWWKVLGAASAAAAISGAITAAVEDQFAKLPAPARA